MHIVEKNTYCNINFISEICAVSKISKKEIGRVFKLILKTLDTNVDLITTGDFMVGLHILNLFTTQLIEILNPMSKGINYRYT